MIWKSDLIKIFLSTPPLPSATSSGLPSGHPIRLSPFHLLHAGTTNKPPQDVAQPGSATASRAVALIVKNDIW